MRTSAKILGAVLILLLVATGLVWYAALREDHRGALTVTFLDVGRGDAILVEAPSGRKILIDGGPDDSVLRQLGQTMPFYDRSIDMIIASAQVPQKVGGLASVLSRYAVAAIVRSAAGSGAPQVQAFVGAVSKAEQRGARLLVVQRGEVIQLGGGAYIEILFPDRDASQMTPSDGCLGMKLVFGDTSFFFSCGSKAIEGYLTMLDGPKLKSDALFSTGDDPELFLGFASPQFAVVPCGASTTPSAYAELRIQLLDTCDGAVRFVSNGQTATRE